jgi:hypothetical protein
LEDFMKRLPINLTAAFVMMLALAEPLRAATPLVCPAQVPPGDSAQAKEIDALIPVRNAFEDVAKLNAAVMALRQQGVSQPIIVNRFITAYCPIVAAETTLNDAQKTALVRRFAARIVRTVYSLDNEEEVILDVPFQPAVIDAINAKASTAGVSPEEWVANAIDGYLKSAR